MSLRSALSVVVILLAAFAVHHYLGDTEHPVVDEPDAPPEVAAPSDDLPRRVSAEYATLVVHLIAPDQTPIERGEVGLDNGGAVRWLPTGITGIRTITDLEPGTVRVFGRADGRVQAEQKRHVTAGVRTEVKLILRRDPQ